jgi:Putative lumazine-binding
MPRLEQVSAEDIASIERAARDYIEGYLTGDAERMADCLHLELTKRSVEQDSTSGAWTVDAMNRAQMVSVAAGGRGARWPQDYTLTIQDAFRNIATVMINSAGFVDYLHIARFEDRWRIVNVLWEPLER